MTKNKNIILSGAPFSGKTTLLNYFKKKGYPIIDEQARKLINYNRKNNINIFPWTDQDKFERLCFKNQIAKEKEIKNIKSKKPIIMDESVVDYAAYYLIRNLKIPKFLINGIKKSKYDYIFILDVLPNYKKDKDRPWTKTQIKNLQKHLISLYSQYYTYKIYRIPCLPVKERFQLIQKIINSAIID